MRANEQDEQDKKILFVLGGAGPEGMNFNRLARQLRGEMTPVTLKAHLPHVVDQVDTVEKSWRKGQKKHYRLRPHYQAILSCYLIDGAAHALSWAVMDLAGIIDLAETHHVHDARIVKLALRQMLMRQELLLESSMKYNLNALIKLKGSSSVLLFNSTQDLMVGVMSIYSAMVLKLLWEFIDLSARANDEERTSYINMLDKPVTDLFKALPRETPALVKKHESDLKEFFRPGLVDAIITGDKENILEVAKDYILGGLDRKFVLVD